MFLLFAHLVSELRMQFSIEKGASVEKIDCPGLLQKILSHFLCFALVSFLNSRSFSSKTAPSRLHPFLDYSL